MKVDKIDNKQYLTAAAVTTAVTSTLAAGAGYHLVPLFEKNAPTDQFVKEVTAQLDEATRLEQSNVSAAIRKLTNLPEEKEAIELVKEQSGKNITPKEFKTLQAAHKKEVRAALKNYMMENADTLDIIPKEKQTVEQAVDNILRGRKANDVRETLFGILENKKTLKPDNKAGAKEYIRLTCDAKTKKFRKPTAEVPDTAIDFVKGAAKKVRLQNAKKFGIGAFIASIIGLSASYATTHLVRKNINK